MQGWYLMSLINSFHHKAVCTGGLQLGRGWVSHVRLFVILPLCSFILQGARQDYIAVIKAMALGGIQE